MVPTLRQLRRGTTLGKYKLISPLGEGGFSQVWKARDNVEDRMVALKIPFPVERGSEEEEELLGEIRLSAKLEHDNILRIRNADKIQGYYVIASELATETLEDRMQRRMSTRRVLNFAHQILNGLSYAHRHRVIHRDLKPSNLMVYPGDVLRIADFGLAKVAKHTMISATGSGSVFYFAPEQAHGYPCFASDIFSLGIIMCEMLSGTRPRWPFEWPFKGATTLKRKVPPEFIRLLRKAIHFDHRERYRDATEMLTQFERMLPAAEAFSRPKTRTRKRKRKPKMGKWRDLRFREFSRAFGRTLGLRFECPECEGPISEHMNGCPWCGFSSIKFGADTDYAYFCVDCERGLRKEWPYCPWHWGPAFTAEEADGKVRPDKRYRAKCRACKNPTIEGMSYCPWCHTKITKHPRLPELPKRCKHCHGGVHQDYWEFCPWCTKKPA